jgi:pyruvate formate lyase activating enzyme
MLGYIHSFESFGTVDGPGIRFVVFMQGCPLRCLYCHNPDTWARGRKAVSAGQVCDEAIKYKNYFGDKGGVTVSGGEPLLQIEFLIELFTLIKGKGIRTALDTSGILFDEKNEKSVETYERLVSVTDLVLLDIKHIDDEAHRKLTGQSNARPLAFAKFLNDRGVPMWIRHVLVPNITDDDGALKRLRGFIDTLPAVERVEVLPYHTMGAVKYEKLGIDYPLKGVEPPSKERVQNAKKILGASK